MILAHISLVLVQFIYAANHLLAKGFTPDYIEPNGFILVRMGITTVFFSLLFFTFIREKIDKEDWGRLAISGVFGIGASQLLFFNGIALTSALNVGVLMTSTPIATVVLSAFFLKERVTYLKIIGIIIGTIGAVSIILIGKQAQFDSPLGDLFIILNAFSFGAYLVVVKPLMAKYKPLTVITYNFIFGLISIMLFPKVWTELASTDFSLFSKTEWLKGGFIIVFATFFTYLMNIFALKRVSPNVNGSYIYTQPVFVILLTFFFASIGWTENFSGAITLEKLAYMLMIFVGVFLISKTSSKA